MTNPFHVYQPLELFVPNSAGDSTQLLRLTLQAVSQSFPLLSHLLEVVGRPRLEPLAVDQVPRDAAARAAAASLATLFTKFGSDKSSGRNYHHLYGEVLKDRAAIRSVLEIGIGSNDAAIVSNMGASGVPGASLRAFREFLPNATIVGADLDQSALFQEQRIRTYFVDQTDLGSLAALGTRVPDDIDLIIDDGLHAPNANLAVLAFGLGKLKDGGWLVIEDIAERAIPFWQVVGALLPDRFTTLLLRAEGALVFAVQKHDAAPGP